MKGQFSLNFEKFSAKSIKAVEATIRETVFDLTSSIILDTPVDTSRLRSNNLVSIDKIDDRQLDITESAQETINKAKDVLYESKIGRTIYIQNNLDYAVKIEYGGSPNKAPKGMVRINIARFGKYLKNRAKENAK